MLEFRLSFFKSSAAGLSQYFAVLSQVVKYCPIRDSSVNEYQTSDDNFYIDNGTSLSSLSSSSESSFSLQVNPAVAWKIFLDGGSLGHSESTM